MNLIKRFFSKLKNEGIKVPVVNLITEDGTKVGPTLLSKALGSFDKKKFDLVQVATPENELPICKVMPKSAIFKQELANERNKSITRLMNREKEMRIGIHSTDHDLEFKVNKIYDLLKKAFRVKVVIEWRPSPHNSQIDLQMKRDLMGKRILDGLASEFGKDLNLLSSPQVEMKNLFFTVASHSAKPAAALNK